MNLDYFGLWNGFYHWFCLGGVDSLFEHYRCSIFVKRVPCSLVKGILIEEDHPKINYYNLGILYSKINVIFFYNTLFLSPEEPMAH